MNEDDRAIVELMIDRRVAHAVGQIALFAGLFLLIVPNLVTEDAVEPWRGIIHMVITGAVIITSVVFQRRAHKLGVKEFQLRNQAPNEAARSASPEETA